MFKNKKRIEELELRVQVLEIRLEEYRKMLKAQLELHKNLTNEFEMKVVEDIKNLNKKINKANRG